MCTCGPASDQWDVIMASFALQIELFPDATTAGQKPGRFLDQSSSSILVLNVRRHPEPAHVALYHFNGWMTHQLGNAW